MSSLPTDDMDSERSFRHYGGEVDQNKAFRRESRKRRAVIVVSSIVLIALIIITVATVLVHNNKNNNSSLPTSMFMQTQLRAVCSVTLYPDKCYSSLHAAASGISPVKENPFVFYSKLSLLVALQETSSLSIHNYTSTLISNVTDDRTLSAINGCETLLDDAFFRINRSSSSMYATGRDGLSSGDVRTWLSASVTDFDTCLQGLQESGYGQLDDVASFLRNATAYASNSLAIVTKASKLSRASLKHRRLLMLGDNGGFPNWVSPGIRRILQKESLSPNVTVAKDGSGNCTTIWDAVGLITNGSDSRFVIYVKEGVYQENVVLDNRKVNVMIYGDGKNSTIISGSLNFVDGTVTSGTATFAALGDGFIAKDIKFQNTAGAAKHQAVALRSASDQSVFFRCAFDGFQDTLYVHTNRQFYRECDVVGSVDFIFGNAAAVFQDCNIMPRQPLPGQFIAITAQGKSDPNQNTGFSIQSCNISSFDNLTATTYLGRPWRNFSTTVVMRSEVGPFVDPLGWTPWDSSYDRPPGTIYYAEYENRGNGSRTDGRVKWDGYRPNISSSEAAAFTVEFFINGEKWLPETGVIYDGSLSS